MYGTMMYNDPATAMDNMRFKVSVSSNYQPRLHPHYTENGITPPINENEDCISIMSITELVKAIDSGVRIRIFDQQENVPRIYGTMKAFMAQVDEVRSKITLDDDQAIYVSMVQDALTKLEPIAKRLMPPPEEKKDIHTLLAQGG